MDNNYAYALYETLKGGRGEDNGGFVAAKDFKKINIAVAFLILLANTVDCQQDLTRTPEASGTDVTTVAARLVEESSIFPPSNGFLRRIAWVESKDGTDPNTYRNGYHGGIWQVDFIGFLDTQNVAAHPLLQTRFNDIQRVFGINWQTVNWLDLRQPLYSALAARLFLSNIVEAIPAAANVADQARYWKQYYNTPSGAGTEQKFINDVNTIPDDCQVEGIDLTFVMDGSGSIGNSDFQVAKAFVRSVVSGFIIGPDNTRVAVIQYASSPVVEFNLNAHTNNVNLENAIDAISYGGGGTATGSAITLMRNDIFGANGGARPTSLNIPRVGVVITDGRSGDDVLAPSNAARADRITMFAIGVGGFDINELNEIGNDPDSNFVFSADSFDAITNIRNEVRTATCEVSVELPPNETISGVLNPQMVRYVSLPIPPSRMMTFTLETPTGPGATCYLSTRIRNPSKALYEWILETSPTKTRDQVFIDFNQTGRRKKRQVSTPGPTIVYATIENDSTAPPGTPMATGFNFVGEQGNTMDTDSIPPTIICPPTGTVLGAALADGQSLSDLTLLNVVDNVSGPNDIMLQYFPNTLNADGPTTVIALATDAAGNTATCSFVVQRASSTDSVPPTIICPPTGTVLGAALADGQSLSDLTLLNVVDNVSGPNDIMLQYFPNTLNADGPTTVIALATDAAGNTATCSFVVQRASSTAPDPNCPPNQRSSSSSLQEYGRLSWTPPPNVIPERSSFRGCGDIDMAPGTSYMFENVYTDIQGNERTCVFTGSVSYPANGGPAITFCPSNIYLMAAPGANYMTVSWATPRAAVPISRRSRNPDETSIFPLGYHLVVYVFEERNANGLLTGVSVCSFIVCILPSLLV